MNEKVAALYRTREAAQQETVKTYPIGTRFVYKTGATAEVARIDGVLFYFNMHTIQNDSADDEGIETSVRSPLVAYSAYDVAEMVCNGTMTVKD